MNEENLRRTVEIFQILSDLTRIKILLSIAEDGKCVHEISEEIDSEFSNVSHHLKRMRDKGLIDFRREGRHKHYRIIDGEVINILKQGIALAE